MKGLGAVQRDAASTLVEKGGIWYEGCGWELYATAGTRRVTESLLERGLIEKTKHEDGHRDVYRLNRAGYDVVLARVPGTVSSIL